MRLYNITFPKYFISRKPNTLNFLLPFTLKYFLGE
jgi:hypothetical protein